MKTNWKWMFRGMMAFAAACFGIYWGSMTWLKVSEHEVTLPRLPREMDGMRVLHITDLHSTNEKKMNLDIWKTIDTLDFDMAVITGDMIIGRDKNALPELFSHRDGLAALAARVPTYFVAGNHDYWVLPDLIVFLQDLGIVVLQDDYEEAEYNGTTFIIAGTLDEYHYKRLGTYDSLHEMMGELDDGFKIVLSHQPTVFDVVQKYKPDLMLSGHTHGGQLRLPFFPTLYSPGQGFFPKYGDGFYANEDTGAVLFVSRGIGTTMFRIRFFNRPEIAVLTLRTPQ